MSVNPPLRHLGEPITSSDPALFNQLRDFLYNHGPTISCTSRATLLSIVPYMRDTTLARAVLTLQPKELGFIAAVVQHGILQKEKSTTPQITEALEWMRSFISVSNDIHELHNQTDQLLQDGSFSVDVKRRDQHCICSG